MRTRNEVLQKACRLIDRDIECLDSKTEADYRFFITYYTVGGWSASIALRRHTLNVVVECLIQIGVPYRYKIGNMVYESVVSPSEYELSLRR